MKVDDTLVDLILKSLLQKWYLALKRKEIDNFYFLAAEINESFKLNSEIVLVLHRFNLQSLVTYEVFHNLILIVIYFRNFCLFPVLYVTAKCNATFEPIWCSWNWKLKVLDFKFTSQKKYITNMKFFITRSYKFQKC